MERLFYKKAQKVYCVILLEIEQYSSIWNHKCVSNHNLKVAVPVLKLFQGLVLFLEKEAYSNCGTMGEKEKQTLYAQSMDECINSVCCF